LLKLLYYLGWLPVSVREPETKERTGINNVLTRTHLNTTYKSLLQRVDNMSTILFKALEEFDKKLVKFQNQLNQV